MFSNEIHDQDGEEKTVIQVRKEKKAVTGDDEQLCNRSSRNGYFLQDVHEYPARKKPFLIAFQDKTGEQGVETERERKDEAYPLRERIDPIALSQKMIQGMEEHQDHKRLSGGVMNLPEKPSVRDSRCNLFHILEDVPHRPVVKDQNNPGNKAQKQSGKPQAGKKRGDLACNSSGKRQF